MLAESMAQIPLRTGHAFHGGRFFEAIGTDFRTLERGDNIISADVLDAWFDPSPRVIAAFREHTPFLARTSPPAHADGLIRAVSRARGVPAANLCVGGGSSQLIFTCLPALLSQRSRVLILDPMYGEYAHVLENVVHCEVVRHFLDEDQAFAVKADALGQQVRALHPQMVIIVNPNSPTGNYWSSRELLELVGQNPETLFLVDETYIDYLPGNPSLEAAVPHQENLIVMKSMSKVYALSGLRAAYMAASELIVSQVARRLPPWSVSLPAQLAAVEALQDPDYYQKCYRETHALRAEALRWNALPRIQLFDSCASFYLIKVLDQSATALQQQLEADNIFVRNCDSMSTRFRDNFLRIAVKSRGQNWRIATALSEALTGRLAHAG
jgi:histidinol-phosphate/aromatic aminotransferase/cobyric acid decarboxylase-like protein